MSKLFSRIAPAALAVGATIILLGAVRGRAGGALPGRIPEPALDLPLAKRAGQQKAVLAGGCFWGLASVYQHVKGVTAVVAGYAGGEAGTATYEEVSTGSTGHAESVEITYDPSKVTYGQLLKVFFSVAHDPTEVNRQGPDDGTQYRSVIFYTTPDQKRVAEAYIAQLAKAAVFTQPIATQVVSLPAFYAAEAYHQNYAELHPDNPYIYINDRPKVENLRAEWPALYRDVPVTQ